MNHARILRTQANFIPRSLNHLPLIGVDGSWARLRLISAQEGRDLLHYFRSVFECAIQALAAF